MKSVCISFGGDKHWAEALLSVVLGVYHTEAFLKSIPSQTVYRCPWSHKHHYTFFRWGNSKCCLRDSQNLKLHLLYPIGDKKKPFLWTFHLLSFIKAILGNVWWHWELEDLILWAPSMKGMCPCLPEVSNHHGEQGSLNPVWGSQPSQVLSPNRRTPRSPVIFLSTEAFSVWWDRKPGAASALEDWIWLSLIENSVSRC